VTALTLFLDDHEKENEYLRGVIATRNTAMISFRKDIKAFKKKIKALKEENKALRKKHAEEIENPQGEQSTDEIENPQGEQHADEFKYPIEEHDEEIADLKRQHDEEIANLKRQHAEEIERLQQKMQATQSEIRDALKKNEAEAKETISDMAHQVRELIESHRLNTMGLEEKIADLEGKNDRLNGKIAKLYEEIAGHQMYIVDLQKTATTARKQVDELQTELTVSVLKNEQLERTIAAADVTIAAEMGAHAGTQAELQRERHGRQ
jgi:chromosome segregation ATPase